MVILFAEDPLDLGTIVIQGETATLQDTMISKAELSEYCLVSSNIDFSYSAYYSPMKFTSPLIFPDQKRSSFQLKGGLDNYTTLNAVISTDEIINFSAYLKHFEKSDSWKQNTYEMQWQPKLNENNLIFDVSKQEFPGTKIFGGFFNYNNQSLSLLENGGFLGFLDLTASYYQFEQLDTSAEDFCLNMDILLKKETLYNILSTDLLDKDISGFGSIGLKGIGIFDDVGIWCAYDSKGVYPSLILNSKFRFNKYLQIRLEQSPFISAKSHHDRFHDNILQSMFTDLEQTKKVLNSTVTLENNYLIPISLYYQATWEKDHVVYRQNSSGFYDLDTVDSIIQKGGIELAFQYWNILLRQNLEYMIAEEILNYEPLLTASTKLEFTEKLYQIEVDLQILSQGETTEGRELDTYFMLDLFGTYKLRDNISLFVEVNNLFDQSYRKYDDYSAEELQVIFGARLDF